MNSVIPKGHSYDYFTLRGGFLGEGRGNQTPPHPLPGLMTLSQAEAWAFVGDPLSSCAELSEGAHLMNWIVVVKLRAPSFLGALVPSVVSAFSRGMPKPEIIMIKEEKRAVGTSDLFRDLTSKHSLAGNSDLAHTKRGNSKRRNVAQPSRELMLAHMKHTCVCPVHEPTTCRKLLHTRLSLSWHRVTEAILDPSWASPLLRRSWAPDLATKEKNPNQKVCQVHPRLGQP